MSSRYESSDEQQRAMDDMLHIVFANETVPRLPSDFNARLRARLRQEPFSVQQVHPNPLLSPSGKLLLRLYWTMACLASTFILFRTEWPTSSPPTLIIATILVSAVSLSPLILIRHVRSRLSDVLLTALG